MTDRKEPIYLTTFSGCPPKEEAMIAIAINRIYTPILRQQVPEIVDLFLPMEALSYKAAIISIDKAYPGQARREFVWVRYEVVTNNRGAPERRGT